MDFNATIQAAFENITKRLRVLEAAEAASGGGGGGGGVLSWSSVQLFDAVVIDDAPIVAYSAEVDTNYCPFVVYLNIDSTGVGGHYIFLTLQFYDAISDAWYNFNQDIWATIAFEDVATSGGLLVSYRSEQSGMRMRLKFTGVATTALLYFTISGWADVSEMV
jgi:hypothetical protein